MSLAVVSLWLWSAFGCGQPLAVVSLWLWSAFGCGQPLAVVSLWLWLAMLGPSWCIMLLIEQLLCLEQGG
jgi:hypothetical protein